MDMSTKKTRDKAAGGGPGETARLPAVTVEQLSGDVDPLDRTDSWASTDSWKLGPEQQRDLEREAELGTLRSNLATMAESRGYLENSLRSLTSSLRELEARLLGESSRTSGLESDLRAREAQLAGLQKELEAGRAQWAGSQAERESLQQQLQALQEAGAAQLRVIEMLEAARQSDQDAQQAMLLEHEARAAALSRALAQIGERESAAGALQSRLAELDAAAQLAAEVARAREQQLQESVAGREAELAHVTAELAEARQRIAVLQSEQRDAVARADEARSLYDAARERGDTLQQSLAVLETSHADLRAQHEALQAGAGDLRNDLRDQLDMIRALNEQLDLARRGHDQALTDLKIAEERIRAADVELRNRDSRIERLGTSESEHKSRAENFARRLAERDGLIQRLEREAESSAAVLGKIQSNLGARLDKEESALPRDLVARLLVRNDGNTEIVQVLGRRTLIGRGVDCQLQIDADFVSRRHALVLVMPDETVIEDLNSTNGVYVNGTRVSRRRLAEGDNITIGKTVFRYVLKPVAERGS